MAGSVNKVIIMGNLGKDPEIRNFPNGGRVCNFSVAKKPIQFIVLLGKDCSIFKA